MAESNTTKPGVRTLPLMIALLAACVAFQLNATMLNPVLVTITRNLGTDERAIGLSQTAFFMSAALFSVFMPRLSDIAGRKRVLFTLIAITGLGSVLAALAPGVKLYFLARIIQGVSGPVVPLCLLMLHHTVGDGKRYGLLMGIITAVNGGIAGIDAFLGGFMATHWGFRPVFWFIAAICALALVFIARGTSESCPCRGQSMDWPGVLFLVLALAGLLSGLNEASHLDQASLRRVVAGLGGGLMAFILFWQIEKRRPQPLVTTAHLQRRATWALLLTTVLVMAGVFGVVNDLAVSLAQNETFGFGLSANDTALWILTPYALIGWAVGPVMGRLAPTLGYTPLLRLGIIGCLAGIGIMAVFSLQNFWLLAGMSLFLGVVYAGTVNIILNGLGVVLSPADNPGFLPGLNATAFHLGAGLSFAVLPAAQVLTPHPLTGYFNGMLLGLAMTGLGLMASFLIPRPILHTR